MSTPTRSDGERELANQIRYFWSDMAPGELEKLIAAHVAQRVAEARKAWESESATDAHRSALEAVEYWKDQWNKQTAEREQLAALVVRLRGTIDSVLKNLTDLRDQQEAVKEYGFIAAEERCILKEALALVPADLADSVVVKRSEVAESDHLYAIDQLTKANAALEAENRALRDVVKWSRRFVSEAVDKYGGRLTTGDSAECDLAQETLDNIDAALAPKEGK